MSLSAHWYVYDGSQVSGPFTVETLNHLRRDSSSVALSKLMVSKRGLDQWHPFLAFDELVGARAEPFDVLQTHKDALSKSLNDGLTTLGSLHEGLFQSFVPVETWSEPCRAKDAVSADMKVSFLGTSHEELSNSIAHIATMPLKLKYLLLRTRMRMGDERNAFLTAFVCTLFSIGTYIPFWIRTVYRELNWHLNNDLSLVGLPHMLLLCTPGYQAVVFYRLARFLQLAEAQLGYQRTNAKVAAFFGVIPPFGMYYLQRRFNEFWNRRVQLELAKQ